MPRKQRAIIKSLQKNALILLFLSLSVFTVSCSFFRNFTTYFNVLYLAQQHLDMYEDQVEKDQVAQSGAAAVITTHRWLDEEYLARQLYRKRTGLAMPMASIGKSAGPAARTTSTTHLDSAIILGSKVLADKNATKYVEDALFIVGKSQYYKNDFAGAKRKFGELLSHYPDTKYGTEVGMLLARAMMATNQYDTATTAIDKVLRQAESRGNKTDISEAHKAYADLLLASMPDSLEAAAAQLQMAEHGLSSEDAARLAYLRGVLYFLDGKWSNAEAAFRSVIDKSSDAATQGEALVGLGETLRREKKFAEAKGVFQSVMDKSRYVNSHPPAHFEYAYTVDLEARDAVQDDLKSANYRADYYPTVKGTYNVLDTTYRNISQAIMARSRFRQAEIYRNMGYYDSASHVANIILGTKDFSSGEMNDYVNDRIRALTRFAEWKSQLQKVDTVELLLRRLRRRGASLMDNALMEIHIEAEQRVLGSRWQPDNPPVQTSEEQKLIKQYEENIRKERTAAGVSAFSINFSDTTKYIDSIHFVGAHAHFELGRAYENFVEYPSAIAEYRQSFEYNYMNPDTAMNIFRAQVLFTWIELDNQMGNTAERDQLLGKLTRSYGETIYAQQANKEYSGVSDKDSPGQVAFRSAYATLKSFGVESAKPALLKIVADHTHEDVAGKSLYTIGVGYEDLKRYDSAVVYYRRVVKEYPYSQYAEFLKPKMLFALGEPAKKPAVVPADVPKQVVANPVQNTTRDSVKVAPNIQKPMPPSMQKPAPPGTKDQKPPQQPPLQPPVKKK